MAINSSETLQNVLYQMDLGTLTQPPEKLTGGLMHTMFAAVTDKGKFAVKALNPAVMKRKKALDNTVHSEAIARTLSAFVPAVPAICKNGKAVQELDGSFYMVFPWQNGKSIFAKNISIEHCRKIGELLGTIHGADVQVDGLERGEADALDCDWEDFLRLAQREKPVWRKLFAAKFESLCGWTRRYEAASKKLSKGQVLSHRDLDPKNVLWEGGNPYLIDWEAAGYVSPDQELIEVVNYWACDQKGRLDRVKFCALVSAYNSRRSILHADWPSAVDSGFGGMLGWLAYNMNRSLGIECSSEEERRMGGEQVKGTIRALRAYEKKADLLLEWIGAFADG